MKDFSTLVNGILQALNKVPERIGTEAVNFSKERFVNQDWEDTTSDPWTPRSRKRRGGTKRQNGAILVDSGRLKRSIRKTSVSPERVVIVTDVEYAALHNEGLKGTEQVKQHTRTSRKGKAYTVRAHARKVDMPERRFMGDSEELCRRLENIIIDEIQNSLL
jgi:phage gpG-like protein